MSVAIVLFAAKRVWLVEYVVVLIPAMFMDSPCHYCEAMGHTCIVCMMEWYAFERSLENSVLF